MPEQRARPVSGSMATWMRAARSSAARRTWLEKSPRICRVAMTPTATAKKQRMMNVRMAEPPATRQRMGSRRQCSSGFLIGAEDIDRAADRVQQPRLAVRLELAPEDGHEDLDGVGHREGVVPPDLVQEPLTRDDQALVAHEVLEQLELALCEIDRALA